MPSSSLVLSVGTLALSALLPHVSAQTYSYTLQDSYSGSNFYNMFDFFTDADPTHGFVKYVDQSTALASDLIGFGQGTAKWGVDHTNVYANTSAGRPSVRLEGKNSYNHGLFLADIKHMPGSICGTWPAFWTLGDSRWPAHGEVDILEGVNLGTSNQYNAHTADTCTMKYDSQLQTGPGYSYDCALSTGGTAGCAVGSSKANDYGTNFNTNGGGVYAMQWTSDFLKIWFFPRGSIPSSITAGSPDVTKFGKPEAWYDGSSCDIDDHFQNHRIIFDTTFCGDWAGSVYSTSTCPYADSGTNGCVKYVAENPKAFAESYWEVNYVNIYSESVSSTSSSVSSSTVASTLSTGVLLGSSAVQTTMTAMSTSTSLSSVKSVSASIAVSSSSSSTKPSSSSSVIVVSGTSKTTSVGSSTASSTLKTSSVSLSVVSSTSKTSTIPASSTSKATSTNSSITSSTVKTSSSSSSSSTTSKASTAPAASTSKMTSSSSGVAASTIKISGGSTTSKASTISASKASTSSASSTLKTSTTPSKTTSASATPIVTTAVCPRDNRKIFISNSKRFLIECSTDHANGNLKTVTVASGTGALAACIKVCGTTTGCVDVTLSGRTCYLKSSVGASSTSSSNGARLLS